MVPLVFGLLFSSGAKENVPAGHGEDGSSSRVASRRRELRVLDGGALVDGRGQLEDGHVVLVRVRVVRRVDTLRNNVGGYTTRGSCLRSREHMIRINRFNQPTREPARMVRVLTA